MKIPKKNALSLTQNGPKNNSGHYFSPPLTKNSHGNFLKGQPMNMGCDSQKQFFFFFKE